MIKASPYQKAERPATGWTPHPIFKHLRESDLHLQPDPVTDHSNKLTVGWLALGTVDSVTKKLL